MADDETLHTLELSVADLLDHSERGQCKCYGVASPVLPLESTSILAITFSPKEGDVGASLPSLLIATERRNCNNLDNSVSVITPKHF